MSETNSNIVWSPDKGWHDGPEVKVTLDEKGRIVTEQVESDEDDDQ